MTAPLRPCAWPLEDQPAAARRHRVVHIFSTRWGRRVGRTDGGEDEVPATWPEAEGLRAIALAHGGCPLAQTFRGFGHLERQYARVAQRMPVVLGTPLRVEVPHRFASGDADVPGHLLVARVGGGQLLVCLSLEVDARLAELPDALIFALDQGRSLPMRRCDGDGGTPTVDTTLEAAVHRAVCTVDTLARATAGDDDPRLMLASELHSMIFVRDGDTAVHDDDALVRRLLGRLPDGAPTLRDAAIVFPGEFNRFEGSLGAVRPGASLIAGQEEPVCRNALVSALLLMGSASLLREARDEAYAVLAEVTDALNRPRPRWSVLGADPFEAEQSRLASLAIAVAFQVESHLDIRRVVSDAYLSDFHQCLAAALAIPQSVEATTTVTTRLEAAIAAASTRSTSRNAFVLTFAAGVGFGLAALLADLAG